MRLHSVYAVTCPRCGKEHQTVESEFICACGLVIEIQWPAKLARSSKPRTITERYEDAT